jgi:hypothetical protein
MNKPPRSLALAVALTCAALATDAHARTLSYPYEVMCVAPPAMSSIYADDHDMCDVSIPGRYGPCGQFICALLM